jgi:transketolase
MKNKQEIISKILNASYESKEGHIPSSLSILELLYVIYDSFLLKNQNHKFVLSKGHASLGLYAVMDNFNLLEEDMRNFCKFESKLGGHPSSILKGIECSTGSLGHGMPFALGMAIGKRIIGEDGKVFTIIGDGEANEGTIWESALLASHHKMENFCCILDHNHSTDRALDMGDIVGKFKSFGWACSSVDGHDVKKIKTVLSKNHKNKPHFILAHTIKGNGIDCMVNNPAWHHKTPSQQEIEAILNNIEKGECNET